MIKNRTFKIFQQFLGGWVGKSGKMNTFEIFVLVRFGGILGVQLCPGDLAKVW